MIMQWRHFSKNLGGVNPTGDRSYPLCGTIPTHRKYWHRVACSRQ